MHILILSIVAALALVHGASAAVAAIPTGASSAVVVERPAVTARDVFDECGSLPFNIKCLASFVGHLAHDNGCAKQGHTDTKNCPLPTSVTIFAPPENVAVTTTTSLTAGTKSAGKRGVSNGTVAESGRWAHAVSVIASIAHEIGCEKSGLLNAFCDSKVRRGAESITTTWTTVESTSTVGLTTTTVLAGYTSAQLSSSPKASPKTAYQMAPAYNTFTDSTGGISVVETTVTYTSYVQYTPPARDSSALSGAQTTSMPNSITGSPSSTKCINNTSIDTQSYLNISTFSMSYSFSPPASFRGTFTPPGITETSTTSTEKSTITPMTPISPSSSESPLSGYHSASIYTANVAAGKSTVDLGGIHLPVAMVAAMVACFALALFL